METNVRMEGLEKKTPKRGKGGSGEEGKREGRGREEGHRELLPSYESLPLISVLSQNEMCKSCSRIRTLPRFIFFRFASFVIIKVYVGIFVAKISCKLITNFGGMRLEFSCCLSESEMYLLTHFCVEFFE